MECKFKNYFEIIKDYKIDIDNIFRYIKNKTEILTDMYNDYLKEIEDTINYRLSLDSFNFQTKLINIENNNYNKIFKYFINRMYGDYYKLYNKLIDYIKNNFKNIKIVKDNRYPKYKDLEVNIEYNIEIIHEIYSNILSILTELSNYCLKENYLIKEIIKKQNNGININNFLNEKKYSIIILEKKINFYYEILKNYIESQNKFLKRLYLKLKIIYAQLCHDINLETSIKINSFSTEGAECNKYDNFSFSDSSESLFERNIEYEINKHLKQKQKNTIIQKQSKELSIEKIEKLNQENYKNEDEELSIEKIEKLNQENYKNEDEELSDKESIDSIDYTMLF